MLRTGLRALRRDVLFGAGFEAAWVAAHVALYPLGVGRERARRVEDRFTLHGLPPRRRALLLGDVEAAGTPILLVHGVGDNRSIFSLLRRRLTRHGFGRVVTVNYAPWTSDVAREAARLGDRVEQVCAQTGYDRVHVVGHSLGGIIARYYVQVLAGDARVHTLVTLGSPHAGTRAARLLPLPLIRQLRPGSALMQELAAPAPGCRTRFVAFWSDLDQLMVPRAAARLEHPDLAVRNVAVHGVGHVSLPASGQVVRGIVAALALLSPEGRTVTAGVTPLASAREARPARPAPPGRRTAPSG